jgi:PAS domain S-box-containing protein
LPHSLLERQLRRCGLTADTPPATQEQWQRLLDRIDRAYTDADEERYLAQRSQQIASSELHQLNKSLQDSEASLQVERDRLAAVMESLGDGLFAFDGEGRCTTANAAAARILGWSRGELVGTTFVDSVAPELAPMLHAPATLGSGLRIESGTFRRRDGSQLPVTLSLTPILRTGTVAGSVLVFHDITERTRLLEAVERERAQLLNIVADAPIAIAIFDLEMRCLTHSRKWAEDHALERDQVLGKSFYELEPDASERWRGIHERCLRGERLSAPEDVFVDRDGSVRHLRWAIHPWQAADGSVGGLVVFTESIEDLVRAREVALEAARLKSEFLATMSHEIRTPMNGVLGMTSLLLETELTHEQRDFASTIQISADNLLTIINDILDFSKIEAGKMEVENIEFSPRTVVESVLDLLAESAHKKQLELACLLYRDVPATVVGDPVRLRQVLFNLVGNAIKFTPKGEVMVTMRAHQIRDHRTRLEFSVRDTGIGMSEEVQRRLFQSFTQGDGSTTRRYGGTGLGLVISKRIVELMGGSIEVESVAGGGSCFRFTIACDVVDPGHSTRAVPELDGLRVLVCDDNETNRRILAAQTSSWGMRPTLAVDADDCLRILRRAANEGVSFDVAILDMCMPGTDGLQLAEAIHGQQALATLPLVMLTSSYQRLHRDAALGAGFAACLTKPVSESRLMACLQEACGREGAAGNGGLDGRDRAPPKSALRARVLLVEDNLVNQRVAERVLSRAGFEVVVSDNGRSALDQIETSAFDLVLMDCQMPEMDGFEATIELRRREELTERRTPIIALTAGAMEDDRRQCLDAGMDDYVSKPFRPMDLIAVVEKWCAGRRAPKA